MGGGIQIYSFLTSTLEGCEMSPSRLGRLPIEYGVGVGLRRYREKKYLLTRLSTGEHFTEMSLFHAENRNTIPRLSDP